LSHERILNRHNKYQSFDYVDSKFLNLYLPIGLEAFSAGDDGVEGGIFKFKLISEIKELKEFYSNLVQ
jgi:hypothetical protein